MDQSGLHTLLENETPPTIYIFFVLISEKLIEARELQSIRKKPSGVRYVYKVNIHVRILLAGNICENLTLRFGVQTRIVQINFCTL